MKFEFNIQKKHLYIFSIILIVIGGSVFVIGFNTNTPPNFGHSLGEIDSSTCSEGQVIQKVNGVWSCGTGGSGTGDIIGVSGSALEIVDSKIRLIECPTNFPYLKWSSNKWNCDVAGGASLNSLNYFSGITGKPAAIDTTDDFGGASNNLLKLDRIGCGGNFVNACASGGGYLKVTNLGCGPNFNNRCGDSSTGKIKGVFVDLFINDGFNCPIGYGIPIGGATHFFGCADSSCTSSKEYTLCVKV